MNAADEAIVYFNPKTIEHKKLEPINREAIKSAFNRDDLQVFESSSELLNHLKKKYANPEVILMMSSGTFDGMDLKQLTI
jgi:UDP-N-acetylmuramate: L-alanyl-gamma-D-glutamyl-meso-diaminopimelate ligase